MMFTRLGLCCPTHTTRRTVPLLPRADKGLAWLYGLHDSIRINERYRICFRWETGYADEVEIADYH